MLGPEWDQLISGYRTMAPPSRSGNRRRPPHPRRITASSATTTVSTASRMTWSAIWSPETQAEATTTVTTGPACAIDAASRFKIKPGGFRKNNATGHYEQTVTLQQLTLTPIQLRLSLVLDGLSPNATLFNKTGVTSCAAPAGSPYINVTGNSVLLEFTNPSDAGITYIQHPRSGRGLLAMKSRHHNRGQQRKDMRLLGMIGAALVVTIAPATASVIYDISMDTAPLMGHAAGPFRLEFQLNDGSGMGDANNTVALSDFDFSAPSFLAPAIVTGGASGSAASTVTLTYSAFFNRSSRSSGPAPPSAFTWPSPRTWTPGGRPMNSRSPSWTGWGRRFQPCRPSMS